MAPADYDYSRDIGEQMGYGSPESISYSSSSASSRRSSEEDIEFFDYDNTILVQFCPGLDVSLRRHGISAELRHTITMYYQKPMHSEAVFRKIARQWTSNELTPSCNRVYTKQAAIKLLYGHISGWDTSRITDMSKLFQFDRGFKPVNLNDWDVSNVTNMNNMFHDACYFNSPLDKWDVSNVTDMGSMFHSAARFNACIDRWSVGKVTNMSSMFYDAAFNQPINNWDVSQVTDMSLMFSSSASNPFNQPLDQWNVSKVTKMTSMFSKSSFNQPINTWNVSQVTNMCDMFFLSEFNQPLDKWDVRNVKMFDRFVRSATSFSHHLSLMSWKVSKTASKWGMLEDSKDFNNDLNKELRDAWEANRCTDF